MTNTDSIHNRTRTTQSHQCNRLWYLLAMFFVIFVGLLSRTEPFRSIPILGNYFGDGTWAIAAYTLIRFIAPSLQVLTSAVIAVLFSFLVEVSQLWHPAWLDALREYKIIGLLIGHGFIWIDLLAYTIGVATAALSETLIRKRFQQTA